MSKTTKRKHVEKEILGEFILPSGTQEIVRVVTGRGNNLHEIETSNNEQYLVSMPTKFRNHVWIKRGDYVVVEPISEGDKVKAEIVNILYKEQIKYIKEEGCWPDRFSKVEKSDSSMIPADMLPPSDDDSGNEDLGDLVSNPNRPIRMQYEEEEETSSEESDEEQNR